MHSISSLESNCGFIVRSYSDFDEFRHEAESLGNLRSRIDVRSAAGGFHYYEKPDAVPPHTDNPNAEWVVWYCVEADQYQGGTTRILDTQPFLSGWSEGELGCLSSINICIPGRDFRHPIINPADFSHLFFIPHLVLEAARTAESVQRQLIERLYMEIFRAYTTSGIDITLRRGQALFLNNRRFLHGRDALEQDSTRHLIRFFL